MRILSSLILLLTLISCQTNSELASRKTVIKFILEDDTTTFSGFSLGKTPTKKIPSWSESGGCIDTTNFNIQKKTCVILQNGKIVSVYAFIHFGSYSDLVRTYKELVKYFWDKYRRPPFGSFGNNYWIVEDKNMKVKMMLLEDELTIVLNFIEL